MSTPAQPHPPVVIPRPIEYFGVGVFAICALYGFLGVVAYDQVAATAIRMYPGAGGKIFLALLGVGGTVGLISYMFKTVTGPKVELASLTLLVVLCIAYSLWTPFSVGSRGMGLLLFMGILIAVPGFFRRRKLMRYIQDVESITRTR